MLDLVVLTPDRDMEFALAALLKRHHALNIRQVQTEFLYHQMHDSGVRANGAELLSLVRQRARHALMCLDFYGSGGEQTTALDLEAQLDQKLSHHWGDSAKAIVIDPELEVLMWGPDTSLEKQLKWNDCISIRDWLKSSNFVIGENNKPIKPKDALLRLCSKVHVPHSPVLFRELASKLSLKYCSDPALQRLTSTLQRWFPPTLN
jgi:hypothetical protein